MAKDRSTFLTSNVGDLVSSTKTFPLDSSQAYSYVGNMDGTFAVQVAWEGGIAPVDMDLELLLGTDPNMPFTSPTSVTTISDLSGSHLWDVVTGATFIKVKITVRTGSATFKIKLTGRDL